MKYSRIKDYQEKVADGYQKMKSQKVAICSIVRNCGLSLRRNIPQIEKLRKCFNESHVIIVENDSTDNTKEVLERWSQD
ncbi:MAG: hypothetical protein ACYSR1_06095 [Planctomycetota bacterium]|jgi:glycosyltransferase involved in cell wall biosynthesis